VLVGGRVPGAFGRIPEQGAAERQVDAERGAHHVADAEPQELPLGVPGGADDA
jgi:hypothetical protein